MHSFEEEGLTDIYQLQGGILNFLAESKDKSSWQGDCFVFDERVTVTKDLVPGDFKQCFACRRPLSKEDLNRSEYKKAFLVIIVYLKNLNQIELDTQNVKNNLT